MAPQAFVRTKDETEVAIEIAAGMDKAEIKATFDLKNQQEIAKYIRNAKLRAKRSASKASLKASKPKAAKKPAKGKASARSAADEGVCSVCGKPLSRHSSVQNGMGDVCAEKTGIAQSMGYETVSEHYDSLKVEELPKGYMKLRDAVDFAKKNGVSGYAMQKAWGGNRMLGEPLNKDFKVIVFKNARYIPVTFKKHLKSLKSK